MFKVTRFMHIVVEEGPRLTYSYSEIDDKGKTIDQNIQGDFIVLDKELQAHIDAINQYIENRIYEQNQE